MADIDLGAAIGGRFQTCAEFVALSGGINAVERFAEETANTILRQFGAILGPVGFQHAGIGQLQADDETQLLPEILDDRPHLGGGGLHHQPTLAASPFDADLVDLRQ